jgi:DNA polymerase-3 subunit alpha
MSNKLVHLHVHSEYSLLDGCGKQSDFVKKAVELGCPAVCFTEHGSIRGAHKLHLETKKQGIKPIYGIEFYLAKDIGFRGLTKEEKEEIASEISGKKSDAKKQIKIIGDQRRKNYHITVLAKNNRGLKNLYALSSISWGKHFYYKPRVSFELLEQYAEGLIILSGCLSGILSQNILEKNYADTASYIERFKDKWGNDFYLELMPNREPDQIKVNKALVKFAEYFDVQLVGTIDAHYIEEADALSQEVLLCINSKHKMDDPNRFKFGYHDYWYKSYDETYNAFIENNPCIGIDKISKALENTLVIAEKCSASLETDRFKALLPKIDIPNGKNEFQHLIELCLKGWDEKSLDDEENREIYVKRLKRELKQIKKQKVDKYFLIIKDVIDWARDKDIAVGPGRGSVGGSLVAYLLDIVDVNPIKYGLIFERFINPERIDLPDIDCDFQDNRRDEIIDYLRTKYGESNVSQISTISRLTGKLCFRDLARVLNIPIYDAENFANTIVVKEKGDKRFFCTIQDAILSEKDQQFNQKYPDVLTYSTVLEGQTRGVGVHAAGVVVGPNDLWNWVPLETRKQKNRRIVCTAFDMKGVEDQGLLKIDILGSKVLTFVKNCLLLIEQNKGIKIDLNQIDMNDQKVLDNFTKLRFLGIFQLDTKIAEYACNGVKFESFDDVIAMLALNRPGTMRSGLTNDFIKRKSNPKEIKPVHPIIDEICKDTLGIMTYQEHVIRIFTDVAGFSAGKADLLRKVIAKSQGSATLETEREAFLNGAVAKGFKRSLAEKLFGDIIHFGHYSFNKAHATAYGMTTYRTMWLKTYYPIEFYCALLSRETEKPKIMQIIREAKELDINVLQPNVNNSEYRFSIIGSDIQAELSKIKGVGPKAIESIVDGKPYDSFYDFLDRNNLMAVNKGAILALAKAGALDDLLPNPKWFIDNIEEIWLKKSKRTGKLWLEDKLKESKYLQMYTNEEKMSVAFEVSPFTFGRHPIEVHFDFLYEMPVKWLSIDDDIWENSWGWVRGIVSDIKHQRDGTKQSMTFGLEDENGISKKVKLNWDLYNEYFSILKDGAYVVVLLSIRKRWNSIRAKAIFSILDLKKIEKPNDIEKMLLSPVDLFGKSKPIKKKSRLTVKALILNVEEKRDKNGNEMAFSSIYCKEGLREVVVFNRTWEKIKENLFLGNLVEARMRSENSSFFLEEAKCIERNGEKK